MSSGPRLFKVDPVEKNADRVAEIDFANVGLRERHDIQEWVARNPSILGEDLLIIAKEFGGFDRTHERADLVAVDTDGNVVVIELKRDDTGADVHWQAIKYASYFQRAEPEDVVGIFAAYAKISEEEATERLKQHLDADDLSDLNRDQRIVLASHRFAPQVTSAVVWLNEKMAADDLISCVELVPYQDAETNSFYIQATTILPVPGVEEVLIGPSTRKGRGGAKTDEVTRFFKDVGATARRTLPEDLRPDRRSRWAGTGPLNRYYQIWYSAPPWSNYVLRYQLLLPKETRSAPFTVTILFRCDKQEQVKRHRDNQEWLSEENLLALKDRLCVPEVATETRRLREDDRWLLFDESRTGDTLNGPFRDSVAEMVSEFIGTVTPIVNDAVGEAENQ